MFKGLSGLKKAVKGGISAVAENTSSLAEQGCVQIYHSILYLESAVLMGDKFNRRTVPLIHFLIYRVIFLD